MHIEYQKVQQSAKKEEISKEIEYCEVKDHLQKFPTKQMKSPSKTQLKSNYENFCDVIGS